jgi:hypothetical protein
MSFLIPKGAPNHWGLSWTVLLLSLPCPVRDLAAQRVIFDGSEYVISRSAGSPNGVPGRPQRRKRRPRPVEQAPYFPANTTEYLTNGRVNAIILCIAST